MKRFIAVILTLALAFSIVPGAFAATDEAGRAARALYDLGLFQGTGNYADGTPNFDLDRTPTRAEAVTMLVRLLGKDAEAKAGGWTTPFTDVADWAMPYVGYAYKSGLTTGTGATTFGGDDPVNATQYLTFVLRALGYTSGVDFQWDSAWTKSDEIGLTDGRYNAGTTRFTRGDVAVISERALSAAGKGSGETLLTSLVAARAVTQEAAEAYLAQREAGAGSEVPADVIVPGNVTKGSARWTALEEFLTCFGLYGDYNSETAAVPTRKYEHQTPTNTLEKLLTMGTCRSYNDARYPGEAMQDFWWENDPLGRWVDSSNSYSKVNGDKLEWILHHIFNCSQVDIQTMKQPVLAGENASIYYLDGYYYFEIAGLGSNFEATVKKVEQRGSQYYVEYDLYNYGQAEPRCAVMALKEIDGREYWTIYECRKLEAEANDWRVQYQNFVYGQYYWQYGPYNEGDEWGWDYNPVTFSLRDLGGDGIPELIIYNGSEIEAGAIHYVFTVGSAGVQYLGAAGSRIGNFTYRDNPQYPGLFYWNGNMGYFAGHYYSMAGGELVEEQVFVEDWNFERDGGVEPVITQVTADNALFSEFRNGASHDLPAYTMAQIDAMGWDAFVRVTSGQTWS